MEVPCDADSDNRTSNFAGTFLLLEPSDGLEPSTPSLPWRIRVARGTERDSACYRVFPVTTPLRLPSASLPRTPLTLPDNPRTCPQNLSPKERGVATAWLHKRSIERAFGAADVEVLTARYSGSSGLLAWRVLSGEDPLEGRVVGRVRLFRTGPVHDEVGGADRGVSADGVVELVDGAQTARQYRAGQDQP
jgi:hypothetical protein